MFSNFQTTVNFTQDTLAPFQYFRVFRAKGHLLPEERLMFAVLNDAVECLEKYHDSKRRRNRALYREAKEWVLSTNDDVLYSFENVCNTLKLDAEYLRLGLQRWIDGRSEPHRRIKVWREPLRYRNQIGGRQMSA